MSEHFEVLSGTLAVRVDGRHIEVSPGESLEIPRGAAHTMGVAGEEPVRAIWRTRPALGTETWWASLDQAHLRAAGGAVPLPVLARLVRMHPREFQLALPRPLAWAFLAVLARVPAGRHRGGDPDRRKRAG